MNRYVDANELLTRLPEDLPYKASVKRVLMQVPTADVAEVKHGEWVYGEYDIPHCSECGYEPKEISPFCPDCGANMDGERRAEE